MGLYTGESRKVKKTGGDSRNSILDKRTLTLILLKENEVALAMTAIDKTRKTILRKG